MFVKMYGLPEYGTFDPTPYVAVTYMLMFGIMFGDVGQGLAISALGLLLSKLTKNGLAPIMTRIGLFSAAFGVLYGSVFGIETIIEPFFHRENIWKLLGYTERPENIFQVATVLLIAALAIGIVLIVISMTFNTVLNFRKKLWGEAWFSINGVCGLVFYISLIAAAACMFMLGTNLFTPVYIICLIVLPLVLIFFKHPLSDLISGTKHSEKVSVGTFIIENFNGGEIFATIAFQWFAIACNSSPTAFSITCSVAFSNSLCSASFFATTACFASPSGACTATMPCSIFSSNCLTRSNNAA